ncbi:MAG: CPBP family intramembrane glutamic endopeptidase [Cyclobacteriaceae bacterium]
MQNILKITLDEGQTQKPWVLLIILAAYVFISLFVFQIIGILITLPLFNFDFGVMMDAIQNPYGNPDAKLPLLITQGATSIGAFIIAPLVFTKKYLNLSFTEVSEFKQALPLPVLMAAVIIFCFMIVNSVLIEWNQGIVLPEWLSGLEKWARDFEDRAEALTKYLTAFDSLFYFLIALIVVAVVPAIGEELLFRGLIQNLFHKTLKNAHVAIWVSALLFALFHFQFYGLVPRMMLGVLFGYLYLWSGNLTLSMVGHFVNNAFSLSILYLSQTGSIDMNPEELESSPPYYVILLFLAAGIFFLVLFRRYFLKTTDE